MRTVYFLFLVFVVNPCLLSAQEKNETTSSFTVSGAVKQPMTISIDDLERYASVAIGDVDITNHKGEKKSTAKGLKGVPLRKVLEGLEFNADNPRYFSEFYLTFIASDGYKVVYSWNELFNSATGNSSFVVTEKDGKKMRDLSERILIITPSDEKTGRRYVKGLQRVIVSRVN